MNRTHLDLFSGIGGFALAARWCGVETVGFCEIEPYAQRVLTKNFCAFVANNDCHVSGTPRESQKKARSANMPEHGSRPRIHPDIFTLNGSDYRNVWLVTGGFPCQPFSVAGKRGGEKDDRYLWPEMLRVIAEARPSWVLGENVAGIVNMALDRVLSDLENIGYACWPLVIPAVAVDARHRRDRVWIVGHSTSEQTKRKRQGGLLAISAQSSGNAYYRGGGGGAVWQPEPAVGRVAHGIPSRVDRLRGLGNAIVPQVAEQIIRAMIESES